MTQTQTQIILTPDNTETSPEILAVIARIARGNAAESYRVWADPTEAEALAIWETVTHNGLRNANNYTWGHAGSNWAISLGIEDVNND